MKELRSTIEEAQANCFGTLERENLLCFGQVWGMGWGGTGKTMQCGFWVIDSAGHLD